MPFRKQFSKVTSNLLLPALYLKQKITPTCGLSCVTNTLVKSGRRHEWASSKLSYSRREFGRFCCEVSFFCAAFSQLLFGTLKWKQMLLVLAVKGGF